MQKFSAKEIARATVLYSITIIDDKYHFCYYGKCDNKVGALFKHIISIENFDKTVEDKGFDSVLAELEKYRQNPLETIYRIINEQDDKQ